MIDEKLHNNGVKDLVKFIIFFPCAIISIFVFYTQIIIINILFLIITLIKKRNCGYFLWNIFTNYKDAFNYRIIFQD